MRLLAFLLGLALIAFPAFSASPPSGNNLPVQATKTGNYTVKSTDLKTVIPMNCAAPCTVTLPPSTSGWPKGYPVQIVNVGSTTVTVHAGSLIYGMPTTAGDVLLTAQGNYVTLNADPANNYLAYGLVGTGGGGGGPIVLGGLVGRTGGGASARNGGGRVARN